MQADPWATRFRTRLNSLLQFLHRSRLLGFGELVGVADALTEGLKVGALLGFGGGRSNEMADGVALGSSVDDLIDGGAVGVGVGCGTGLGMGGAVADTFVGANVGRSVGKGVGKGVGRGVGGAVSSTEGTWEWEGLADGRTGANVGGEEGANIGSLEGTSTGSTEGARERRAIGCEEGVLEGWTVGSEAVALLQRHCCQSVHKQPVLRSPGCEGSHVPKGFRNKLTSHLIEQPSTTSS